jgi:DNA-binding NarL/FixJ family response regulator
MRDNKANGRKSKKMPAVLERTTGRPSLETRDTVRVLIVDDHTIMREGLRRIMEEDRSVCVVGEATNGREAIEMAHRLNPDVITMDIKMPIMDGITATREIKRAMPGAVIMMLTLFTDDYVKTALEAGASGFILKDSEPKVIIESIHQARDGYYPISPSITKDMMSEFAQLLRNNRAGILSERQVQILKLVAEGQNSKEIADKIFVSPSTAKREIRQIMTKLEANDRAQAVSRAIHQKLI